MTSEELTELGTQGSKALGKLSDLVKQTTFPNVTKRQTKALINDANKKAEFIRNNPDMDVSFQGNEVNIRQLDPSEFQERAELRLLSKAIRQQENFEKVLEHAYNDLQDVDNCSDESVDLDWWSHFESCAENISNEEMQFIWGKILSGEIQRPGSFSHRTLETVRNISTEEASIFQKICSLLMFDKDNNGFVINDNVIFELLDISYVDLLKIDSAGLFFTKSDMLTNDLKKEKKKSLRSNDYIIILALDDSCKKINIPVFSLTEMGNQLSRIINCHTDIDKLFIFVKSFVDKKRGIKSFTCHKILDFNNSNARFFQEPEYEYTKGNSNE